MYVIIGTIKNEVVYFSKFENQLLFNTDFDVHVCSFTINGTKLFYDNESDEYVSIFKNLRSDSKIYTFCPKCMNIYFKPPAISRIDNITKICSECGIKEALEKFIKRKK